MNSDRVSGENEERAEACGDRTSWKSERCDYAPLSNNTYSLSTLTCGPPLWEALARYPPLCFGFAKRNVFNVPRSARAGKAKICLPNSNIIPS